MLKLAMVGALDSWHGRCFSVIFNGFADNIPEGSPWRVGLDMPRIEGATITKVWDPSRELAEEFARVRNIPEVVSYFEEAASGVDGVIAPDDCVLCNHYRGLYFIQHGVPCLIDKPLAARVADAVGPIEQARKKGALMLSASSIRFSDEIMDVIGNGPERIGPIHKAFGFSPNPDPIFYGIHAVEPIIAVMGAGVESVQNIGTAQEALYTLRWADGRTATISCSRNNPGIQSIFFGKKGCMDAPVRQNTYYLRLMEQFVKMIQTGTLPVPFEETLEILKIGEAAVASVRAGGQVVKLSNVL